METQPATVTERNGSSRPLIDRIPAGALVVAGSVVLIVLAWVALVQHIKREKTQAIENTAMVNASLTRALGEHVGAAITIIDMDSRRLAGEIERTGIDPARLGVHLRRLDSALPFIQQVSVIDAEGTLAASAPAFRRIDLSDREHFRHHRDNAGRGLFISTPVRYVRTGAWTLPVTRRLFTASGGFAGVLTYSLDAEFFTSYFSRALVGGGAMVTIARSDGIVLTHRVGSRTEYAESPLQLSWLKSAQAAGAGWTIVSGQNDGERHITAYQTRPDYSLFLALGTPLERTLAAVERRLPIYYWVVGAASAGLLLAAILITFLLRRQTQANRDLAASEARFRGLAELSADWYWEQDEQFRLTQHSGRLVDRSGGAIGPALSAKRWDVPASNLCAADWAEHRAALERHESFRDFEIERANRIGTTAWISLSGEPVFAPDGAFRGYRGVGRNISERKQAEQLLALEHAIACALAANESTESILVTVIRATCETQGWQCGRYFSLDQTAGVLRYASGWLRPGSERLQGILAASTELVYARGEGLIGRAWQSGQPEWIEDPQHNSLIKHTAITEKFGTRSAFAFPVLANDEPTGVFAFTETQPRRRDERLIQTAGAIGSLVGLFLQRRRAEQKLREAEQRYHALVDLSPDGIVLHDMGSIQYVNASAVTLFGAGSPNALLGRNFFDFFESRYRVQARERVAALAQQGVEATPAAEVEFRRLDGALITVEIAGVAVRMGGKALVQAVLRDVTVRNSARKMLELEHAVNRCLADAESVAAAMNGILRAVCATQDWACGRWFRLDDATDTMRCEEFWSIPEAKLAEFAPRARAATYLRGEGLVGITWQSGEPLWVPDIAKHPGAKRRIGQAAGLRGVFIFPVVADSRVIGVLSFNSDKVREPDARLLVAVRAIGSQIGQYIQRRRAEQDLRDAEERHRSLLMASYDGIWIHRDGRIDYANDAMVRMLGYASPAELTGTDIYRFFDPEERAALRQRSDWIATTRQSTPLTQTAMRRRDGTRIDVETTGATFMQKDTLWLIGIIRDVTERRGAEREILRLNSELEQRVAERTAELGGAVKEMEAFTYTVAHDLRSPLRAINGYCEILLEEYQDTVPEEGRGYLRRVATNAARLGMLIDDLLAFSRCSRVALERGPVDLESLFAEVIAEQVPADSGARVCVGALPACVGDRSLLRQVATNLISNAVKYSRNAAVPSIDIGHADGAYFVRDNGAGFDMRYADKLFGVFNRLHRSEDFEGTGVGLAIVRRIVERHGGRVWAHAETERGASFYFTLG